MKIFMLGEADRSVAVRITNSKNEWIDVMGKYSDDHMPAFGCELDDANEKELLQWLLKN